MIEHDKRYLTKARDASRHNRVSSSTQHLPGETLPRKTQQMLPPLLPPPAPALICVFPGEHLDLSRTDEAETDGPTQRHRHVPTYQHARR